MEGVGKRAAMMGAVLSGFDSRKEQMGGGAGCNFTDAEEGGEGLRRRGRRERPGREGVEGLEVKRVGGAIDDKGYGNQTERKRITLVL